VSEEGELRVGERAFYPVLGVVELVTTEAREIGGSRQRFYVLAVVGGDRKVLVPTANAEAVGLRRLASPAAIEALLSALTVCPTSLDTQTWNRRARAFADRQKTGQLTDTGEIVRELGWRKKQRPLAYGERRVLDATKTMLVREIASALGVDEAAAEARVDAAFEGVTEAEGRAPDRSCT
jgi:CarD family transcriptional regulator